MSGTLSGVVRVVLTFLGLFVACWLIPGSADDFHLDWLSSQAIWTGGDPYERFVGFSHQRIPAAHLLQLPFGLIPEGWQFVGSAVWVAAGATLLVWVAFPRWWWAAPFLVLLWPFSEVDRHGHPTFFYMAMLVIGHRARRPWVAGLCFAVAVSWRLFPWVIVLGLLIVGLHKTVAWTAGWFAGLNVAGLLLPGVTIGGTVAALSEGSTRFVHNYQNLSAARFLPIWTMAIPVVIFAVWAVGKDRRRVWNGSLVTSVVAAPLLWPAYLPVLLAWKPEASSWRPRNGWQPARQ